MRCPADSLTRKHLEKQGYIVDKAESYNHLTKRKKDLFRFIDFVAIHPSTNELLAIQTTSKSNLSTRVKKAEGLQAYWHWLATGNPVEFHGWYKPKGINRWEVKILRKEKPPQSDLFD